MSGRLPIVVFSDLDGTLLDDRTYSHAEASDALERLSRERIPLVFCTSKTRAEVEWIQQDLGIHHPFICENGGGVFVPAGYFPFDVPGSRAVAGYRVVEFGRPYEEVVEILRRAAAATRVRVVGFHDMSVEKVASECHLPVMLARLAKLREYAEPFRVIDSGLTARSRLIEALRGAHMACTEGGRFDHVGAAVDKGVGVNLLRSLYRQAVGPVVAIGLGDAPNDLPLLQQVDLPYIVRREGSDASQYLFGRVPNARVTQAAGTAGWAEAVLKAVDDLSKDGLRVIGP
jgi:mannosyl-3-phosphoglycerate phosphatase